jgi:two-component system sensor histidine kinase UhpB
MGRSAAVTLAVVLASLYLAFLIGRGIRRPLRSLSAAAEAVAQGDPGARARVKGASEIARVALQFDRMLDSLAEKDASLREANLRLQQLSSRLLREVEEERGHIARELHDHVGQSLTALEMDLKHMHRHPGQPVELVRIERCLETVWELLEQVRGLSLDLRPSQLDDLGLVAALRAQIDRHFDVARVQVHLEAEDLEARLTRDLETAVFRICQEALTNVLRHARARNVRVTLRAAGDALLLTVRDDGAGFDAAAALDGAAGRSSGLRNMLDRAGLAGGTLAVRSAPGSGTEIEARLPL